VVLSDLPVELVYLDLVIDVHSLPCHNLVLLKDPIDDLKGTLVLRTEDRLFRLLPTVALKGTIEFNNPTLP
jgi:hypothetical protein